MPESRQRSVRRQLLVLLLTTVSVAWIIAATVSFRDARHEVAEVLDAHLAQTASLISVQRDGDERRRGRGRHRARAGAAPLRPACDVPGLEKRDDARPALAACTGHAALDSKGWIQ